MLVLLILCILASCAALAYHTAVRSSLTADETKHIATAVYRLEKGRCCLGRDNSPSLALNALLLLPGEHPGLHHLVPRTGAWRAGRRFLREELDLEAAILKARLPSIALLVGLGLIVFAWSRSLYGTAGGFISLFLVAFSPSLLAHGSLAAADIHAAFFMTLALWSYARFTDRPGWIGGLGAGACLGLALSAKYTGLILIPCFGIAGLFGWSRSRSSVGRVLLAHAGSLAGIVLVAFLVVWLAYGGVVSSEPLSRGDPTIPLFADFVSGLQLVWAYSSIGWPAYLLEEYSDGGWWYYYPVAMLVKTPLPALIAVVASVVLTPWIARVDWRREGCVALTASVLLAAAMTSKLNIGIRHVLPIYPLLYICAGRLALLRLRPSWVATALLVVGGAWYLLGTLRAHPHHLAYYNEAAGGPGGGYRIVADSAIDWGQDLKELRSFMDRENVDAIRLAYFGGLSPGSYGIRYQPLPSFDRYVEDPGYSGSFGDRELLVVSAYSLLGIHPARRQTYQWLRKREPVARPGYSLFAYDITGDLEAHLELIRIYRDAEWPQLEALEIERLRRVHSRADSHREGSGVRP